MNTLPDDVVLSVEDLSVDFCLRTHILHAVEKVSFQLKRGQTLCLVGESGSGKSVTARSLLQIIDRPGRIVGGRILLKSGDAITDIATLSPDSNAMRAIRGRRIGLVFQEPMSSLSPVHTIGSQIVEAIRLHTNLGKKAARERMIDLLRQVEIPNPDKMADRYTFEFSGGMRQRAMIAMALAGDPDILIADEPTTALDVTTQAEILDLIKRLQVGRGMAMLLITHDMGVVAEVADEVAVMRFGRIVEHGTVDAIYHAAGHPYTRQLLASTVKLTRQANVGKPAVMLSAEAPLPVLSVRNLGKTFGFAGNNTLRAVDDANFDLYPGEALGIVGESGSGKTTLGRLILRIVEPTAGAVFYRNKNGSEIEVTRLGKKGLRDFHREVRLVFQDPFASLNPRMTVKEVIGDPLIVNGPAKGKELEDRVAELMRLVGLDPMGMERYPHAFSGGQRQRIGIARALALEPRIIIADEATSALDVSIRSQILDLLLDIRRRLNLSFIFISHDISVVRYFCDRVAVMHRGRIVELGEAEQVCTAPREAYTKSLISAVPNPDPRDKRMMHRQRFVAPVNS
ncbi:MULTISPECIES: ABC transporter ATP-binding protein [Rhizobium/Agrobacterium group]|uniref:ABC transporter ATP-binding protein n=2 Tax=Neorhizobium TaxID=1525371 RepID=A0ABV0M5N2_9HYPH|nr:MULTISPECIES: ABC transporter ATP-binding protein [Rhizobium/Agrobacterium group]KGE02499.1 ABC transporter ATP-binding protein [Rhizobium sp. YS-1r]MCC2613644.1 ABC transporter ATP-binding protein [Neorhizobium petrolearium]WGI71960.1 ABC transporter ATP-binding protein [Neorhizobium petrolearium]